MPDGVPGPFGMDVMTNTVNVHWAGGLAVEFGDTDKNSPDTGKPPEARRKVVELKLAGANG